MKYDLIYDVILVIVGAVPGALLRYGITEDKLLFHGVPVSVLIVNLVGSFILGLSATAVSSFGLNMRYTILIGIGFCGSLTTMSSFAFETVNYMSAGELITGGLDILLNVGGSLFAIVAGRAVVLALSGA
jgi:CrcB protein